MKLSGYVDIDCGGSRIQADTVVYDTRTQRGTAEGTVVLDWENSRITGERLEFDLSDQTGTMTEAMGWVEPETIMKASIIRKIDEEHVLLEKGEFTTCTQPIPYWSFRVGRGLFHLGHYAHLRNVRLKVGRVPVIYFPWMLWPIKGDRAAGFLPAHYGTSHRYGFFVGEAFFLPLGRSADVTMIGDYYVFKGPAGGIEANWLPTEHGSVRLDGYYLKDNVRNERRYTERAQFEQPFGNGWRLVSDLNGISDSRYNQDFGSNLSIAATNFTVSTLNLVRNGEFMSFNFQGRKRRQLSEVGGGVLIVNEGMGARVVRFPEHTTEDTQETLPEVEIRGRSRRLPGTPLYFSFNSSIASFRSACDVQSVGIADIVERNLIDSMNLKTECGISRRSAAEPLREGASWQRIDLTSGLAMPLHPAPWLTFEPRALLHETYYTAARVPETGRIDEGQRVGRRYYEIQGEIIGPKLYRVFTSNSSYSSAWKNVIEPRLLYRFVPVVGAQDLVPVLDGHDAIVQQLDLSTPTAGLDPSIASDASCRDLIDPRGGPSRDHSCATLSVRARLLAKRAPQWTAELAKPPESGARSSEPPWSSFLVPAPVTPAFAPAAVSQEGELAAVSKEGEPAPVAKEGEPAPAAVSKQGEPPPAGAVPPGLEATPPAAQTDPVEIATLEISQSLSLTNLLTYDYRKTESCAGASSGVLCANGRRPAFEGSRRYGPLGMTLRVNPFAALSIDLGLTYDAVNDEVTSTALSGWYRRGAGFFNATWSRLVPADPTASAFSQVRVGSGAVFFNRKLTLDGDLGYDLRGSATLDRRARVGYYTQCCGFIVEYLARDFENSRRRDVRLIVDLKGIGQILDHTQ